MASKLRLAHLWFLAACCLWQLPHECQAATEYNRYLAHIFQKYGSGGTMSFEGLEHLMYSLGLGQLEFDPMHTIDEHRPPGFEGVHSANDQQIKQYIEQQTVHLLSTEDDDVAQTTLRGANGTPMVTSSDGGTARAASPNRSATEKGFVLEFKEMHDPRHRHPRENDDSVGGAPLAVNVCLSPKSLLRLVVDHDDLHKRKLYRTFSASSASGRTDDGAHNPEEEYNEYVNSVKLTPVAFMKLCPALLAQIDQHVCARPAPLLHAEDPKSQLINAWIYATGSIFVLSACGLLGILMVPLMRSVAYQEILSFLVAVAVGTLSGDALMHLLPHALEVEHAGNAVAGSGVSTSEHGHDNTPVWICACAFVTAIGMYVLENLLPLLKDDTANASGHGHGHSHSHNHTHRPSANDQSNGNSHTQPQSQPLAPLPPQSDPANDASAPATAAINESSISCTTATSNSGQAIDAREINVMLDELKKDKKSTSRPLTPLAFMVVIGDGLHNLTDGLAIGAAFATDPVTGMATAFAVLCHELPHELGDFALLLQTGVSLQRAVCLNLVSSVLSFLGMAIGLLIAGLHSNMTQWIYAATAGSFLYIAFADLIPAMGAESAGADGRRTLKNVLIQCCGIALGGLIMLVIAVNEDALEKLFQ